MKRLVLSITGMSCGHCVGAVKTALAKVPGVEVHSVSQGRAEVTLRNESGSDGPMRAAIKAAGYEVSETVEI